MAGERLSVEVDGDSQLVIDVQGNLGGPGWTGLAFGIQPADSWREGDDVSVVVLHPPSHRDIKATAQVAVVGGSVILRGTTALHW